MKLAGTEKIKEEELREQVERYWERMDTCPEDFETAQVQVMERNGKTELIAIKYSPRCLGVHRIASIRNLPEAIFTYSHELEFLLKLAKSDER